MYAGIAGFFLFSFAPSMVMQAQAQAGSSAPVIIESSEQYYDGLTSGRTSQSGIINPLAMLPKGVLKLAQDEKFLLWVELASGRLNLLEQQDDGGLVIRKIFPISIGSQGFGKELEGDKKTPVGIYHFTSFIKESDLLQRYGTGAYPLNYPNSLDRRLNRTGSGIWLHGLPKDVDQRPFLDSDGCVVIDNVSLLEMANYIDAGTTHIMLTENDMEWVRKSDSSSKTNTLESEFEAWRLAWETRDNDTYLSFYANDFNNFSRDKIAWDAYKRLVNNSKSSIQIGVSNLSFFADPKQNDLIVVRYYQHYVSSNYSWDGWKEQLWREGSAGWQIVYEG